MEIMYTEKAEKQIKRIWKGNRSAASTIINAIEDYAMRVCDKFMGRAGFLPSLAKRG